MYDRIYIYISEYSSAAGSRHNINDNIHKNPQLTTKNVISSSDGNGGLFLKKHWQMMNKVKK